MLSNGQLEKKFLAVVLFLKVLPQLAAAEVRDTSGNSSGISLAVCGLETGQNAIYEWIPENQPPGTIVKVLPIQGRSSEPDPEIRLRLVTGNEWLQLNTATKEISIRKLIDRDADVTFVKAAVECLSLVPADNFFKVNISINVKIKDVNDNTPIFEQPEYNVNITEELPIGTPVFKGLKAVDADQEGPHSQVMYAVVQDGPYSDMLLIPNPYEGTVVIKKRIDFESIRNFSLTIAAKDAGRPSRQSTAVLRVWVKDADDLNPKFEYDSYRTLILPETPLNTTLDLLPRHIVAIDQDTLAAHVVYSLSGPFSDKFWIDPETAEIRLARPVMSGDNFLLNLHAKQRDRPEREAGATVKIRVAGESSNRPRFLRDLYQADIVETAPVGSQIVQVSAIDPDKRHMYDRSLGPCKPLPLAKQRERPEPEAGATVKIRVAGESSNRPRFLRDLYQADIVETAPVGSQIVQVSAIDSDKNALLTYALVNPDQLTPFFHLDRSSGVLSVAHPLDYEQHEHFALTVEATDGTETVETRVEINVLDVNDNAPRFPQRDYEFWPVAGTDIVGVVKAEDNDPHDEVVYHLLNMNSLFTVDKTGQIRVKDASAVANATYELIVMAQDTGQPPRQGHTTVRLDFTNATQPLMRVRVAGTRSGGDGLAIIMVVTLAAVSCLLFLVCLALLVYLCQKRGHTTVRLDFTSATQPLMRVRVAGTRSCGDGLAIIMVVTLAAVSCLLFLVCLALLVYLCPKKRKKEQSWYSRSAFPGKPIVANPVTSLASTANMAGPSPVPGTSTIAFSTNRSRMSRYQEPMTVNGPVAVLDMAESFEVGSDSAPRSSYTVSEDNNSPHGSQSPLHHDSHDRAMSITYGGPRPYFAPTTALQHSSLLETDAIPSTDSSLHHRMLSSDSFQEESPSGSSAHPGLTVYF